MEIETIDVPSHVNLNIEGSDSKLIILPVNFGATNSNPNRFASTMPTVLKLAKQQGLEVGVFGNPKSPELLEQRSFEWFAPSLFISSMYFSGNQEAINIALNMIASYLMKVFAGSSKASDGSVSLDIFIKDEATGKAKKVRYRGPPAGLKEVGGVVKSLLGKDG